MNTLPDIDYDAERLEVLSAIRDSIASWRRIFRAAAPGNERGLLRNAAADLFRTRKVSKTGYPGSDGIVNQAIVDALADLAAGAGIDDDDAQLIFAQAESGKGGDRDKGANGHALVDELPPAMSLDEFRTTGTTVPATIGDANLIAPAAFVTPADWPQEAPPPVDWLAAGRIPRGDVTTLHGDGGTGKTDIAIRLAANIARSAQD